MSKARKIKRAAKKALKKVKKLDERGHKVATRVKPLIPLIKREIGKLIK
jgi:DNA repair photolyase